MRFLTDISKAWDEEMRRDTEAALQGSGELDEIVAAAPYLASNTRSFSTGSVTHVDGGAL
ncbi:MAG: SDR family oxidoreductase [Alphaproteobacteria bacterium]|nr:SDR family oxidoreductase [Alphaproteobacteria bacterium]